MGPLEWSLDGSQEYSSFHFRVPLISAYLQPESFIALSKTMGPFLAPLYTGGLLSGWGGSFCDVLGWVLDEGCKRLVVGILGSCSGACRTGF